MNIRGSKAFKDVTIVSKFEVMIVVFGKVLSGRVFHKVAAQRKNCGTLFRLKPTKQKLTETSFLTIYPDKVSFYIY